MRNDGNPGLLNLKQKLEVERKQNQELCEKVEEQE